MSLVRNVYCFAALQHLIQYFANTKYPTIGATALQACRCLVLQFKEGEKWLPLNGWVHLLNHLALINDSWLSITVSHWLGHLLTIDGKEQHAFSQPTNLVNVHMLVSRSLSSPGNKPVQWFVDCLQCERWRSISRAGLCVDWRDGGRRARVCMCALGWVVKCGWLKKKQE